MSEQHDERRFEFTLYVDPNAENVRILGDRIYVFADEDADARAAQLGDEWQEIGFIDEDEGNPFRRSI